MAPSRALLGLLTLVVVSLNMIVVVPASSSPSNPPSLEGVVYVQDQLLASLQTTVGRLREENAALREQVRVMEAAAATVEGAARAPVSALRAEVLRLVARAAANAAHPSNASASASGPPLPPEAHPNRWREPQHVTITCNEAATVLVRPLAADDRGPLGECLLLEVQAPPQLDAKFALYCGPEEREDVFDDAFDGEAEAEAEI
jgi:hypothetical protein